MIERTFDAGFPNAVINHPSVHGWVRGPCSGPLDLSPVVADRQNVLLVGEYGFALFVRRVPGVYEMHAAIHPEGQGRWALTAAAAALEWMFVRADAWAVLAPVPANNAAARYIVGALGFDLAQVLPDAWPSGDGGKAVPLRIYTMLRKDWLPCQ